MVTDLIQDHTVCSLCCSLFSSLLSNLNAHQEPGEILCVHHSFLACIYIYTNTYSVLHHTGICTLTSGSTTPICDWDSSMPYSSLYGASTPIFQEMYGTIFNSPAAWAATFHLQGLILACAVYMQVTTGHACSLRMWICMKWHYMVHGCMVYAECAEMAAVSCGTSHVTIKQRCKYTTSVDI